jgi:hypothetical protein
MEHSAAAHIIYTLIDHQLVTNEGDKRLVQSFGSEVEAKQHLLRLVELRQKDGYVAVAADEISVEQFQEEQQKIIPGVKLEEDGGKFQVTFTDDPNEAVCKAILGRVQDAAPRTLQLICDPGIPDSAWATAIRGRKLPGCTSLIFDTPTQTQVRQAGNGIGDLALTLAALPDLERVYAVGALELSPLRCESLRYMALLADPMEPELAVALGGSQLLSLETLILSFACAAGPGPDEIAADSLRLLGAPALKTVHIDGVEEVADFLDALIGQGVPDSWRHLCIGGTCNDDGRLVEVVRSHGDALAKLESLALPVEELSVEAEESIRAVVAGLVDAADYRSRLSHESYADW